MTKDEIIKDIQCLINTIEAVHPNPYYNSDEKRIKEMFSQAYEDVYDDMTELDVFKVIGPLVTSLNDGHTSVFPGQVYDKYIGSGKSFMPLDVHMVDGELVIKHVLSKSNLNQGDQVLSINGASASELTRVMMDYISSEDKTLKHELVSVYFRAFLWMLFKMEKDFDITYKRDHEVYKTHLKGIDYNQLVTALDDLSPNTGQVSFEITDNMGLMTFESFTDFDQSEDLVHGYFDELIKRDIKHLIIDLRNNSGGDSRYGEALLKRLYDKPFRQFSKVNIKVSDQVKDYYKNNDFIRDYYKSYDENILTQVENAKVGTMISVAGKYIEPHSARYLGQVYLLTSGKTYSSASSFVSAFHDYELGQIIGQSPAGYSNSYGDIYMFTLEHSGLEVCVSHKYHIRPNGDEELNKIIPHIYMDGIRNKSIDDIIKALGDLK
ncbi:hypothetical protein EZV73_01540 [Acidaminobacter sp. JC074]|uniref:S41 family peptidase n=1 Tax=Acidaminobacter sp. JC074 TaxID=2530199 RepID=UPI001F0E612E|nr:S41 family peptidase [Acidaminobacter sp. JC074]MCH4886227.1 hypothetical protein [Acidaminobacter sp. JC074]